MAAAPPAKVINEVAQNSIWREHCKKEAKVAKFSNNFSVPNPERMTILPEKPNATVPTWIRPDSQEVLDATAQLEKLCNAKNTHKLPNQVYELPATSNQEYGFNYENLSRPSPMFDYRKTKCDVTEYAETYTASTGGQSPFMKHVEPAGGATKK